MRDYPTHERIVDVSQPLLVLRGEHDPIAKAAWCHCLARLASAGAVATVPRSRHNAPHARPAAVAEAVRRFWREHA